MVYVDTSITYVFGYIRMSLKGKIIRYDASF